MRLLILALVFIIICGSCDTPKKMQRAQPGSPERIVTLAPSVTEIVFAMGLGSRVAGVSDYTLYPPEALKKTRVGGLLNPDIERISALNPDIILATRSFQKADNPLRALSLPVHYLPERNLNDVFSAIDSVGRLCQAAAAADSLTRAIKDSLAHYHYKGRQTVSALLVLGRAEGAPARIGISGPGAYLDDILTWCGGRNAFFDLQSSYSVINREDILTRNPDVIIEFRADSTRKRLLKEWRQEPRLKAVKNGQVYIFNDTHYLIPGPRVWQLAGAMYRILQKARAGYFSNADFPD